MKICTSLLLFFVVFSSYSQEILLFGTDFQTKPEFLDSLYVDISQVEFFGLMPESEFIVSPTYVGNTEHAFNDTMQYAVTSNPYSLDSSRHSETFQGENMLVFSYDEGEFQGHYFQCLITGLEPLSAVRATMDFCNITDSSYQTCYMYRQSIRGIINPDIYNTFGGTESNQVSTENFENFELVGEANEYGEAAIFINYRQFNECTKFAFKNFNVFGTPKPEVQVNKNTDDCLLGEQILLSTQRKYNAEHSWEINDGTGWTPIGTAERELYELPLDPIEYSFHLKLNLPEGGVVTSETLSVDMTSACNDIEYEMYSLHEIFKDDFGRFDLSDSDGYTYETTNYDNILSPYVEVHNTTEPFRYELANAPQMASYVSTGPPNDGQYLVAAYLTSFNSFNDIVGSQLQWAANITGLNQIPPISYDHSGKPEGACLLINNLSTTGTTIYETSIGNLCVGETYFVSVASTVFSDAQEPADILLRITDISEPSNYHEVQTQNFPITQGGAGWYSTKSSINLTASDLKIEILNNTDVYMYGNDLVLDDVRITTPGTPKIISSFNARGTQTTFEICGNLVELYTPISQKILTYYGVNAQMIRQWTTTPQDRQSWNNFGPPSALNGTVLSPHPRHECFANLEAGDKLYFRTIVATEATFVSNNNFTEANYANSYDPCKNYSVSEPIEATYLCAYADATELEQEIQRAQAILDTTTIGLYTGMYPQEALDSLSSELLRAEDLWDEIIASQEAYNIATSRLAMAIAFFINSRIETVEQILSFDAGLSLFSTAVSIQDSAIETVFAPVLSELEFLRDQDLFYVNGRPVYLNTLRSIESNAGYILQASSEVQLIVEGLTHYPNSSSLKAGWNLIACPYLESIYIETALESIVSNVEVVKDFTSFYEPGNNLSTLTAIEPTKAYFIKVSSNCTIIW